ncbi:MAG: DUF4835 family protein [Flavobacteriales bacterium]|jgi:hypothetical protein|nr:DUF4835 family protein [Flavobacteriales bacterium]
MTRIFTLIWLLITVGAQAQELNCTVTISSPTVQNTEKRIFETLQKDIRQFMNSTKWTNDVIALEERIECSIRINVGEKIGSDKFKATMQVQSSRPTYMTSYNTVMLNVNDRDFTFTYVESQPILFQENQHIDNLSSVLAFYAYMIIGADYDSFSLKGGEPYFQKAQQIVNNAQNEPERGWKAFDGTKNRYWLIENMLNARYDEFRGVVYKYHREGLDIMQSDINTGRAAITDCLKPLKKIRMDQPNSYLMTVFFTAKVDELINIFKEAFPDVKTKAANDLMQMDPANANKYQAIVKG